MFRKFLNGFVFGSGFALAFVLVYTGWLLLWAMPNLIDRMNAGLTSTEVQTVVARSKVPEIFEGGQFQGATISHDGDFEYDPSAVLSGGDAGITGRVLAEGEPVESLRLRLALNGSVLSQWAVTDSEGRYKVPVPPGEYKIHGYELDRRSANQTLSGLIGPPDRQAPKEERFTLESGQSAPGLNLEYIAPVAKLAPTGQVSLDSQIVARWEAYPGADHYLLQVLKSPRSEFLDTRQVVFEWQDRPRIDGTEVDLRDIGVPLEAGQFYYLEIIALGPDGRRLSQTPRTYWSSDFEVIE